MSEVLAPLADINFVALAVRMGAVSIFIIIVALISERLGPFFGAMMASLPVFTGPLFLFLALDHPPEFLGQVAISSVVACGVVPVFVIIYALMARAGYPMPLCVLAAFVVWITVAGTAQLHDWTLPEAMLFSLPIYVISIVLARHFTKAGMLKPTGRSWSDLLLRVLMVTGIVGAISALSPLLPVKLTGLLSIMPTVMISLILVLHGRIGGQATSALLSHSITGMVGMLFAVGLVALTIVPWGPAASLSAGLATSVSWNLTLILLRQAREMLRRRASRVQPPRR